MSPKVQPCSQLYDKNDDCESHSWNGVMSLENVDVGCRQMALYPQVPRIEVVGIRWSKLEDPMVVELRR